MGFASEGERFDYQRERKPAFRKRIDQARASLRDGQGIKLKFVTKRKNRRTRQFTQVAESGVFEVVHRSPRLGDCKRLAVPSSSGRQFQGEFTMTSPEIESLQSKRATWKSVVGIAALDVGIAALIGIVVGGMVGVYSPYASALAGQIGIADFLPDFELAEHLSGMIFFQLLHLSLLVGFFTGTATAIAMLCLPWVLLRSLLLPLLALLSGIVAALIFEALAVQALKLGEAYTIYSVFGPFNAFVVAVSVSLYAGLTTNYRLTTR